MIPGLSTIRRWWLLLRWEQSYHRAFDYWMGWRAAHRRIRDSLMPDGPLRPLPIKDGPEWVHFECACPCECPNEFNFKAVPEQWPSRCGACQAADRRIGRLPHPPIQGATPEDIPISDTRMHDGVGHYRFPELP